MTIYAKKKQPPMVMEVERHSSQQKVLQTKILQVQFQQPPQQVQVQLPLMKPQLPREG